MKKLIILLFICAACSEDTDPFAGEWVYQDGVRVALDMKSKTSVQDMSAVVGGDLYNVGEVIIYGKSDVSIREVRKSNDEYALRVYNLTADASLKTLKADSIHFITSTDSIRTVNATFIKVN